MLDAGHVFQLISIFHAVCKRYGWLSHRLFALVTVDVSDLVRLSVFELVLMVFRRNRLDSEFRDIAYLSVLPFLLFFQVFGLLCLGEYQLTDVFA